jgi:Holliday junction resolvase-like predicted endonuclease
MISLIVEHGLLISLLKTTRTGAVLIEDVKKDSRVPSDTLLKLLGAFQNEGILKINSNSVELDAESRLKLALRAVSIGADVQTVSSFLSWQEFESIAATAFRKNGYIVRQNLRFKNAARKWEIDVVGCRKPLVVCVDCKSWHHALSPSAMNRVAEAQVERARALADALPNISLELDCVKWSRAKFIPVVLVLIPGQIKFYDNVPIVPVLQLQDFLYQLPVETDSLKYFQKEFIQLSHHFQERRSSELQGGNQT